MSNTPVQLRHGTTKDVRLDRIVQFDERSRSFPIKLLLEAKKLRSYTWRCNQQFDQGQEGACVAYSLSHELAARPAEVAGMQDKWMVEHVYWEAQKTDPWEGGSYPGAVPSYEGTSVLAGVKILHKKKFFTEYRWAFSLNDVLLGLGHNGPAVLGVNWYEGMLNTDNDGYVKTTGSAVGGHAIMARSVDLKHNRVMLRNSWGKDWGMNGDCFISFNDLDTLLHEQGEAVFMVGRTAKNFDNTF